MTELERAVQLLRAGELVAIPTETVYGLGADASNPVAVAKIFAAKGRPADHPLIVHIADARALDAWAIDIPPLARRLAESFWPGPLTLILKRHANVPDAVTGGQDTVGLRVPNHPLSLQLLRAFGGGIAAPSANKFGRISPTTASHVREELGDAVQLVLDGGPCAVGIESTIVDLSRGGLQILRPGMISAEQIARVAGDATAASDTSVPRVSGSLDAHYAPCTTMQLLERSVFEITIEQARTGNERIAVLSFHAAPTSSQRLVWRQISNEPAAYAHDLYAALRELDATGCQQILVEAPPANDTWAAVNDRLRRATTGAGR